MSSLQPPQALKEILHWDELRQTKWGKPLTDNWINVAMMLFFLGMAGYRWIGSYVCHDHCPHSHKTHHKQRTYRKAGHDARYLPAPDFPKIDEQVGFDYTTTEPLKLRPFKPKYHLTMGTRSALPLSRLPYRVLVAFSHFSKLTPQPSRAWIPTT
jgi:hypothetical protein